MFATVLYRMAGSPSVDGLSVSFKDVKEGTWSYSAIVWAYSEGITKGVGGDMFAPEQSITREELVTMLHRYADTPEVSGELSFTDASSVSEWAQAAVLWASQSKIVNGYDNGAFGPSDTASRAEMAAVIQRFSAM